MRAFRFLMLLGILPCAAAWAQDTVVTSAAPDSVAVTIYRAPERDPATAMDLGWLEGYALITEKRTVEIPAGSATIRFEGVAGGMLPESALVSGLPQGVSEKNLDADLLSPRNLYARSFGRPVILRRQRGKDGHGTLSEERAIIRSGPDGAAIVQTKDGFEAADCGPISDELVYTGLPDGLSARPTLSVKTQSAAPATVTLSLSYLAWGFDWQTNYVLRMREGAQTADLIAWVTLASSDPTSFPDATAAVVGGKVNREDSRGYEDHPDGQLVMQCYLKFLPSSAPPQIAAASPPMVLAPAPMADIIVTAQRRKEGLMNVSTVVQEEGLGDLKLYRVPIPTTVAANAQKQVAMYDKPDVKLGVVYSTSFYRGADAPGIGLLLRTRNRKEDGLGVALPVGPVAVFEPHGEEMLLVGEGGLGNLAIGEDVEIRLSAATQVNARVRETASGKGWTDYEATVTNANPWPIKFEATLPADEEGQLSKLSAKLSRKNGRALWKVTIPANDEAKLRYRLRD